MRLSPSGIRPSLVDSLDSGKSERETVQTASEDRQLLYDFLHRSNQLANDKRVKYFTSNLIHKNEEYANSKDEIDCAYESPMKMQMSNSMFSSPKHFRNDLTTMDFNMIHNKPTGSDVLFYNQPLHKSCQSIWSKPHQCYYDSISNSADLESKYSSTLQSITNNSVKREGLAECDSLDRKISFD